MAQAKRWIAVSRTVKPAAVGDAEKRAIIAACDSFVRKVLNPRFLVEIRPTEWNDVVDLSGSWAGGRYRFMQRYRSGMEHNRGGEFDAPFARLDRVGPNRFDVHWMRHTGKWWRLHAGLSLEQALRVLETDQILHPV